MCPRDWLMAGTSEVWTSNNELGLSPEDVRAICNVNASLKGAGQTGHKAVSKRLK